MPSPDFLKVHFTICQILQVSGFGRAIRTALDKAYDLDCHGLDPSGSTDVGTLLSQLMLTQVRADAEEGTG